MTERLDEMGWGDATERGGWHGVIGDVLCVGTGLAMASLWAVSSVACFFLPGNHRDDLAAPARSSGTFREGR